MTSGLFVFQGHKPPTIPRWVQIGAVTIGTFVPGNTAGFYAASAASRNLSMFRKVFMGLLAVAMALAIAGAGYKLGKHLANNDNAASKEASST